MSKALVIKGANFAVNKVTTVVLNIPVPCTGLTLSQSSITFSAIGATVQLTAEKTPLNTTDELTWVSSNEDTATVADGLVTCVGVGTTTITATCGTQSATCEVTSSVTIVMDDEYAVENGARYSNSLSLPTKDHIGKSFDARQRLYYNSNVYGNYRAFANANYEGQYLIPIPNGTANITVTPPEGLATNMGGIVLGDAFTKQTHITGTAGNAVKGVYGRQPTGWAGQYTLDITPYPSANGFLLSVAASADVDASTITGKTTVTFE